MSEGFSLVDLKGISEPLTKLIETVSKGVGAIYEPMGKVRNAKAEAKAMLILAEANNEVSQVSARALERLTFQEVRRQNNIDSIVKGAVGFLPETVSEQKVDEDWIVNFFSLGQDIGNAEMQTIWSKLLAGEIAKPGRFKPRTLQTVKSLTPDDANMFTIMCSFSFRLNEGLPIIPVFNDAFYNFVRANGFTTDAETHLKNIGLLSSAFLWYKADEQSGCVSLRYFNEAFKVRPPKRDTGEFLKAFPFTEVGKELVEISGSQPNEEYIDVLLGAGSFTKA
ncbi:DUF2806 domain-containing protein [Pseudomonas viciae]|uniref:DUF2806 domain-containing protein n=1 Tax=Pseudomonas viciae TaxID=2505979 RepID=A0ABY8P9D5_9PSED|nr:DUF2806 domain-containing protein [Pseudomonas viciae]WGO91833.1 DUF2806 domain-containing protein [Pseudomonas viciae]